MSGDTKPTYGLLQYPQTDIAMQDNPDMDIIEKIAHNLSAWMSANPALDTIKKVSSRSGVGFGTVQRVKNGNGNPTISNLYDITKAFGRSIEELIAEPNQPSGLDAREPPSPAYLPNCHELLSYLGELDQADAEIFVQQLRLDALKARKKRQDERPPPASKPTKQAPEKGGL